MAIMMLAATPRCVSLSPSLSPPPPPSSTLPRHAYPSLFPPPSSLPRCVSSSLSLPRHASSLSLPRHVYSLSPSLSLPRHVSSSLSPPSSLPRHAYSSLSPPSSSLPRHVSSPLSPPPPPPPYSSLPCHVFSSSSKLRSQPPQIRQGALRCSNTSSSSPSSPATTASACAPQEEETRIEALMSIQSAYNSITILEVPKKMAQSQYAGCRVLLLDESGNVHSIYKEDSVWTRSYWDQFASLPAIIPDGPIALLGLGGGTAARLLLDVWPHCKVEGWEIDGILVDMARMYLGLSELEVPNEHGGVLQVHIDDALSSSVTVDGGFAGIVVDLFSGGEILPQLRQTSTWLALKRKLRDGGRIMVNCGGMCVEKSASKSGIEDGTWTWEDGAIAKDATLRALSEAFPGQVSWRNTGVDDNYMALTGPFPDMKKWASLLPQELKEGIDSWLSFG